MQICTHAHTLKEDKQNIIAFLLQQICLSMLYTHAKIGINSALLVN